VEVSFSQLYIEAGANLPFSHVFQRYISNETTAAVRPSPQFAKRYGPGFNLGFNISAKRGLKDNEIAGPSVMKKAKEIEYTIFLPFDVVERQPEPARSALEFLFAGVCSVLGSLHIDATTLRENKESLIRQICSDPTMFMADNDLKAALGFTPRFEVLPEQSHYIHSSTEEMKHQLILQIPARSKADYRRFAPIEAELARALGKNHHIDGYDFGSGTMNFFIFTRDPSSAFALAKHVFDKRGLLPVLKAATMKDEEEDFTVLWPNGFCGEFTY
jgi:hypothetical protein